MRILDPPLNLADAILYVVLSELTVVFAVSFYSRFLNSQNYLMPFGSFTSIATAPETSPMLDRASA
jgi:hypothetical protein